MISNTNTLTSFPFFVQTVHIIFFFSSRRRHTRSKRDWSSDVCSSDLYNSNPAAVCPNHNDVIRGLMRPDLFTVVHEQFFTDTTDYADIVLPATTFFEHKELQSAYGHYYLQMSNQAIEPLGECRSNTDVFRALAEKMGLEDECLRDSDNEMIDQALESKNPWLKGITRE